MNDSNGNASTEGLLLRMLSKLIPGWENRQDSEHEQAVIRLIVGLIASIYCLIVVWIDSGSIKGILISGIICFFIIAFAIVLWLVINPAMNVHRRIFGCIIDNSAATSLLFINGNLAAPIFIVYLWVTFGNGFRFGRKYLFLSMTLSLLGFSGVLLFSDNWSPGHSVNTGLFAGLIALPLYVASLLNRLERALKNAEIASQAKSNFLATMSHEIRTPLNGLIGILSLLDMTDLKKKQQHYVDLMKNSSEWLLNVISDSLDFTKIEAGELVIDPVPISIKSTILDICKVFTEISRAKGISFKAEIDESLPNSVMCDSNRLAQVLNNLLDNACNFTDKGEVKLKVTSKSLQNEGVRLFFNVSDSGMGIAKENLEQIFTPFTQINSTDTGNQGGTGLGLAIASRLINLMGGEINVKSKLGVGTTFSFFLDVSAAPDIKIHDRSIPKVAIHWHRKPIILLVEDNEINHEVATTYLKHLGCKVFSASDGIEAMDMVAKNVFDLILMDCQMPRMDGYETTRRIRLLETDRKKTTIVAFTAHVTKKVRDDCFDAGMNDYMGKPYRVEALERLLRKWLNSLIIEEGSPNPSDDRNPLVETTNVKNVTKANKTVHDLRNALGGVIGGVELALLLPADSDKCEEKLHIALKAAQKAITIASELE